MKKNVKKPLTDLFKYRTNIKNNFLILNLYPYLPMTNVNFFLYNSITLLINTLKREGFYFQHFSINFVKPQEMYKYYIRQKKKKFTFFYTFFENKFQKKYNKCIA